MEARVQAEKDIRIALSNLKVKDVSESVRYLEMAIEVSAVETLYPCLALFNVANHLIYGRSYDRCARRLLVELQDNVGDFKVVDRIRQNLSTVSFWL